MQFTAILRNLPWKRGNWPLSRREIGWLETYEFLGESFGWKKKKKNSSVVIARLDEIRDETRVERLPFQQSWRGFYFWEFLLISRIFYREKKLRILRKDFLNYYRGNLSCRDIWPAKIIMNSTKETNFPHVLTFRNCCYCYYFFTFSYQFIE